MEFERVLKKAMVDMNIDNAKALSDKTGVSSYITRRLLKGDKTCSINDLKTTADYLGVTINFFSKRSVE
jgi:hypothetical protein